MSSSCYYNLIPLRVREQKKTKKNVKKNTKKLKNIFKKIFVKIFRITYLIKPRFNGHRGFTVYSRSVLTHKKHLDLKK